jgi:hypothetical protein
MLISVKRCSGVSWAIVTSKECAISAATRHFVDCLRDLALARMDDGTWKSARLAAENSTPKAPRRAQIT